MEVHKPNAPHSWREFLRELGVIVLGVLIALTAEQSAEWLHRYEKRRQLQDDLREELRANHELLREDLKFCHEYLEWHLKHAQAIQAAVHANTPGAIAYEPFKASVYHILPNDSVWQHAKESGTAALLPREQAQAYTVLYRFREQVVEHYKALYAVGIERDAILSRLAHSPDGLPDLSQATAAQLDEVSLALARCGENAAAEAHFIGAMIAAQTVLESGSTSEGEIREALFDSRNPSHASSPPPSNDEQH
jgi:hypothetical protein